MSRYKEKEVFGVNYERFALGLKLKSLKQNLSINTVCEIPAHGSKAAPSLYSFAFALCGAKVTLINGDRKSLKYYEELNIADRISFVDVKDVLNTGIDSNAFDFVWNLGFIANCRNQKELIEEMKRISKRYIAICSVNNKNIGFYLHRFAHFYTKIPWSHGDIKFNNPYFLKKFLNDAEFDNVRLEAVDCPLWPDSIGFRDIRLHKMRIDYSCIDWVVPYIDYIKKGHFPNWFYWVYFFEKLTLPLFLKLLYAHLFIVIGEK